ncbi:hypothetical protein MMC22_009445 [Lobaria immixta]|nr:hypothetical protein [Lobaria immixta]
MADSSIPRAFPLTSFKHEIFTMSSAHLGEPQMNSEKTNMEEENARKIRVLTYRQQQPDQLMVEYRPRPEVIPENVPLQQSRAGSMGRLAVLPIEITHAVLRHLDFQSLEKMMSINPCWKATVESLPAYRDVITHASGTVDTLIATGIVGHFTAGQLHAKLRTDRCEGCGKFGAFLFLLTCSRRCLFCIVQEPELSAMTISGAKVCFGLTTRVVQQLPTLRTTPEIYSRGAQSKVRRLHLVSVQEARILGITTFSGEANMTAYVEARYDAKNSVFDKQMAVWREAEDAVVKKPRRPRSLDPYTITDWGIASTPFPSLNVRTRSVQWGVSCEGCAYQYDHSPVNPRPDLWHDHEFRTVLLERRDRYFSEEEFLQHFDDECDVARSLWSVQSATPAEEEIPDAPATDTA